MMLTSGKVSLHVPSVTQKYWNPACAPVRSDEQGKDSKKSKDGEEEKQSGEEESDTEY